MGHGDRVVQIARGWIGTPYVHQASCRGGGADCLGLIRGIWRELQGPEPCAVPAYTSDWAEASGHEGLLEAADRWLRRKPLGLPSPGDVLVFRMRDGGIAKHLGVQSAVGPMPFFIHAYSGHTVTESALSAPWLRRVAARYEFPEGSN